jgi:hypothetical protein
MPTADTFHGAVFWLFFWLLLGPFVVLIYVPIGVAWIIGCGLYLGCRRLLVSSTDQQK